MGNLRNWTWDVSPQFRIEREDAEALQDLEILSEYIEGVRNASVCNRQDKTEEEVKDTGYCEAPAE